MKSGIIISTLNSTSKLNQSIIREHKYFNTIQVFSESHPPLPEQKKRFLNKLKSNRVKYVKKLLISDNYGTSGEHNKYIYKRITPNFRRLLQEYEFKLFTFFRNFKVEKSRRNLEFLKTIRWDSEKLVLPNIAKSRNLEYLDINLTPKNNKKKEISQIKKSFSRILKILSRCISLKKLKINADHILVRDLLLSSSLKNLLVQRSNSIYPISLDLAVKNCSALIEISNLWSHLTHMTIEDMLDTQSLQILKEMPNLKFLEYTELISSPTVPNFSQNLRNLHKLISLNLNLISKAPENDVIHNLINSLIFPDSLEHLILKINSVRPDDANRVNDSNPLENFSNPVNLGNIKSLDLSIRANEKFTFWNEHLEKMILSTQNLNNIKISLEYFDGTKSLELVSIFRGLSKQKNLREFSIIAPSLSFSAEDQNFTLNFENLEKFELKESVDNSKAFDQNSFFNLNLMIQSIESKNLKEIKIEINETTKFDDFLERIRKISDKHPKCRSLALSSRIDGKIELESQETTINCLREMRFLTELSLEFPNVKFNQMANLANNICHNSKLHTLSLICADKTMNLK